MQQLKATVFFITSLFIADFAFADFTDSPAKLANERISLLESALAPKTPEAVATMWAKAATDRNGAVQYMLMCPDVQKKHLATLQSLSWVTGVSSPSVSDFKLLSHSKNTQSSSFTIQYNLDLSGEKSQKGIDIITIVPTDAKANANQAFCISKFTYLSPADAYKV